MKILNFIPIILLLNFIACCSSTHKCTIEEKQEATHMKYPDFWKTHYVLESNSNEIEIELKETKFISDSNVFSLIYFEHGKDAPNILISQGSGGHPYVFAELGYQIYLKGYNVFIMPKHGGNSIQKLIQRHDDAIRYIFDNFNDRIGIYSEGLGGFVTFYLSFTNNSLKSAIYQNSPAILTEKEYHAAVLQGKTKRIFPLAKILYKISPNIKLPISAYLNWEDLIDPIEPSHKIETRMVKEGYLKDPDFDKKYPLSAIMSLMNTPLPKPLSELKTPTVFMVAKRGFGGTKYENYLKELFNRIPFTNKKIIEVDGSVYWMLSHPKDAASVICEWFSKTL